MKEVSAEQMACLVSDLKRKLAPHLTDSLNQSQLFVDMADAYAACCSFIAIVDDISTVEFLQTDQVETFLVDVDVHLLEHLTYHLESLRKLIPEAVDFLAGDGSGSDEANKSG